MKKESKKKLLKAAIIIAVIGIGYNILKKKEAIVQMENKNKYAVNTNKYYRSTG